MSESTADRPRLERPPGILVPPEMPGELSTLHELTLEERVDTLSVIVEELYGELVLEWQNARFDTLTGRPNRRWLESSLDWLIDRYPGEMAVAFIDLDGTKRVNDTQGHQAGNQYLKTAGRSLQLTTNDFNHTQEWFGGEALWSVRLSGDEFVQLIHGIKSQEELDKAMALYVNRLKAVGVEASIGGRLHTAGESSSQFLKSVDGLMYEQKRQRREAAFRALPLRKQMAVRLAGVLFRSAGLEPRSLPEGFFAAVNSDEPL